MSNFSKYDAFQVLREAFSDADDALKFTPRNTGKSVVTTVRNAYGSTSVGTGSWVQLVASLSAQVNEIEIFDSSGQTLELGTGGSGSEARLIIVFPGGNGRVPVSLAAGTRVAIRAITGTASSGEFDANFYS